MSENSVDVIIIGAGLSGLSLAYYLGKEGISYKILESRDRIGGRIHTLNIPDQAPIELGATWLGKKHKSLIQLLKDLDIGIFQQELGERAIYEPISTSPHQIVQLPPNNDPSFRIQGGTSQLIDKLFASLSQKQVQLAEAVVSLKESKGSITVVTSKNTFHAKKVVSTLPPFLFLNSIRTTPQLPKALVELMQNTHTWMGESIKVALSFEKPFWRSDNLSGTLFSNVGPIPEMYDHSNYEDSYYALMGFLNGNYFSYSKEDRLELILLQLEKYYGKAIRSFLRYEECVWRDEESTFRPYDSHILPHQNNGHFSYRESYLNNRLFIGGSETSAQHPGYMDGAVHSSLSIAEKIVKDLDQNVL